MLANGIDPARDRETIRMLTGGPCILPGCKSREMAQARLRAEAVERIGEKEVLRMELSGFDAKGFPVKSPFVLSDAQVACRPCAEEKFKRNTKAGLDRRNQAKTRKAMVDLEKEQGKDESDEDYSARVQKAKRTLKLGGSVENAEAVIAKAKEEDEISEWGSDISLKAWRADAEAEQNNTHYGDWLRSRESKKESFVASASAKAKEHSKLLAFGGSGGSSAKENMRSALVSFAKNSKSR